MRIHQFIFSFILFLWEKCFDKSHCPDHHQGHWPALYRNKLHLYFKVFILNYSFLNITDIAQKVHFL